MTQIRLTGAATTWTEALPLGNGRLGAMVFGDPDRDRIALNDDTAWSGSPASEFAAGRVSATDAAAALDAARAAQRDGRPLDADHAVRALQERYSQAYLPFGDLVIARTGASIDDSPTDDGQIGAGAVLRILDLADAVATTSAPGFTRDAFVSAPDGVLVLRTSTERPQSFRIELGTQLDELGREVGDDRMVLRLRCPADVAPGHERIDPWIRYDDDPSASVRGVIGLRVLSDGIARHDGTAIAVEGATELLVVLSTGTTFTGIGRRPADDLAAVAAAVAERLDAATALGHLALRERHRLDHRGLFDRVRLELGSVHPNTPPVDTTARLDAARASGDVLAADPGLVGMLFDVGRYLLIASTRPGTLPANLQGIWNDELRPPWSSNFTLNINTQMCAWPIEALAVPELHEPLFELVEALAANGAETATRLYGARGWAAHHNSDAWAFTSPVGLGEANPAWAFWPMAGPWLVRHYGDALDHGANDRSGDAALAERAWPVVRGAVAFLLDWFDDTGDGTLGTLLSTSPENEFIVRDATGAAVGTAAVGRSSAMDLELAHDSIGLLMRLAAALDRADDPIVVEAVAALARIPTPAYTVGRGIEEWAGDPESAHPHHRHVSMLTGLHPAARVLGADELAAASSSLDLRGDEASGWSHVWKTALRARLRQPERVADLLRFMLRDARSTAGEWAGGLYPNLFAAHPPFQIDGNIGAVAAIIECIVQSHDGRIALLPALPAELGTGSIMGVVVRPGVRLDLTWADGLVVQGALTSPVDRDVVVEHRGRERVLALVADRPTAFTGADVSPAHAGERA